MSLRTTVLAQQSHIRELQSADRRRQTVITKMLAADHRRQKLFTEALKLIKRLQTQMAEFERQTGMRCVAYKLKTMQEATEMAIEVMDKTIRTFADRQQRTREIQIITNNHNTTTKTIGKTLAGLMLHGLLRRNNMGDPNPYAENAIITPMVIAPKCTNVTKVWPFCS
ncbi:hypothetical protein Tco_1115454 [Tanacetum coccineum]